MATEPEMSIPVVSLTELTSDDPAVAARVAEAIGGLWSGSRDGDVLASYLFSRADTGKVMLGGLDPQVGGAVDLDGDCLGEREAGPAVERDELPVTQPEAHCERLPLAFGIGRSPVLDAQDLGVGEDRDVELGRVQALGVEPQAGGDLCHLQLLSSAGRMRPHWLLTEPGTIPHRRPRPGRVR